MHRFRSSKYNDDRQWLDKLLPRFPHHQLDLNTKRLELTVVMPVPVTRAKHHIPRTKNHVLSRVTPTSARFAPSTIATDRTVKESHGTEFQSTGRVFPMELLEESPPHPSSPTSGP
jgi:hypothetical protein